MFEVKEEIVVYAFRYALGRMTYVVKDVSDYLIDNWHRFEKQTKERIISDIQDAIKKGEAGMEMDVKMWERILVLEDCLREEFIPSTEEKK